jgi:hypothetical protein
MYVNAKMILAETVPGTRGRGVKESKKDQKGPFRCQISELQKLA